MARTIYLRRERDHLVPVHALDLEAIEELAHGVEYKAEIVRPRSLPHHRKYFAILAACIRSGALDYPTVEHLHSALMFTLGYTRIIQAVGTGELFEERDSASFEAMSQDEFNAFYERAIALLCETAGVDVETLKAEGETA